MKLSMNEATALKCKGTTLEQDLALCEKYGYDMIEIRTMDCLKNYFAVHSIDELAEYFATHPVKPWAFNTLEYFNNLPDDDYKETLRKLREMCEWGKKIGCKTVITVPTVGLKKVTRQAIRKSTLECLKEMGEICGEADMRLSVEFLGHPEASINDFGEAYDIIQELDMENVGLTLDCFHFHGMHSSLADLAQADGKKIFIVHLKTRRTSSTAPCAMTTASGRVMAASTSTASCRRSRRSAGHRTSCRSSSSVRSTTRCRQMTSTASARQRAKP